MSANSFKYILRFTIQPGHHVEDRLKGLTEFCKKASIDDVMFFADCEELNTGHITPEELKPWLELIRYAKTRLDALGITTSINPWTTLVHADRGRSLKEGQDFGLMTDCFGRTASVQACHLSPEWRKYLTGIYALYSSVMPHMIWVEDDFRFHNHAPLSWGGCFCERHMEEYSRKAGKKLTREEFVEGVLKPGEPHAYRKIWLDTCRETMVELAVMIGKAVHSISPATRVGLMSSVPAVHCAEGRDWNGVFKGLAGNTPMVNRPHLPAYCEDTPQSYLWNFNVVSQATRAVIPGETEVYPELDNGPFSRFSVSKAFTRFQLETTACLESEGITLSLFDMIGSGVIMSEGYQDVLRESKAFLNGIRELGLKHSERMGVKVLMSPGSSYTLHTCEGRSMTELYPAETFWASLLASYGIPNVITMEKKHSGSVLAISGQYFRNLSGDELEELFRNNHILLDGEAAYTLYELGYGHLAGIGTVTWHGMESGFQTYEEVCNGRLYRGVKGARMTAQDRVGDYLEINYTSFPDLITEVRNPFGKIVGAGQAVSNNRVFILPYGKLNGRYLCHLNPFRQDIVQEVLKSFDINRGLIFAKSDPYVYLCRYSLGDKEALIMANASNDDLKEVRLYAPGLGEKTVQEMNRCAPEAHNTEVLRDGEDIILQSGLKRLEVKVILFRKV